MKLRFSALILLSGMLSAQAEVFEVSVFHPGFNPQESRTQTVFQTLKQNGEIKEYHADVDSVICGQSQCEVITLRLIWAADGGFLRYEFPKGGNLTKRGHEQFTHKDHEKLLRILKDSNSALGNVSPDEIVHPAQASAETDGTSSATLLSNRADFVPGAVYTCYTLWHWTQGNLKEQINIITANTIPKEQLAELLQSENKNQILFAIQTHTQRKTAEPSVQQQILELARSGGTDQRQAALDYFQAVSAEAYYGAMANLFPGSSSKKQVHYLSSLSISKLEPPAGFYDTLSNELPNLGSYYEVHLLLNLIEEHIPDSPTVINNVLPLLDNKSFLVSRRAFQFLQKQSLSNPQLAQVKAFENAHADRL